MAINGARKRDEHNDNPDHIILWNRQRYSILCDDTGELLPIVDAFTAGYAAAMLWANTCVYSETETDDNGYPMMEPSDLHYDYLAPGLWWYNIGIDYSDAIDYLAANFRDLMSIADAEARKVENRFLTRGSIDRSVFEQHGHDFALTRNHHGAGFRDRGYGDIGESLTEAAQAYGGASLYVDSDNRIWNE